MDRLGTLLIMLAVSLLVLWPTIYAMTRRRWRRGIAYLFLTAPVIWITINSHHWWGPTDPENDFSPLKNAFLYSVVTWPVLTAILWTVTALIDHLLAIDRPQVRHD